MKTPRIALSAIAIASLTIACSGSDDGSGDTNDQQDTGDPSDPSDPSDPADPSSTANPSDPPPGDPNCVPSGDIPCFTDMAEPCDDSYSSGFPGDEYCRAAPDPSIGYQIRVGPSDYTDPDEIAKYAIVPGQETNWATGSETPNDVTVYTSGYFSYMRPGSHHFIMFGLPQGEVPLESDPQANSGVEAAGGALGGEFLGGATRAVQIARMINASPEDMGIGAEVAPRRPLSMNLHFINTTDVVQLQELWMNSILINEEDITLWSRPMTWYGGLGMRIQPGEHVVLENPHAGATCAPPTDLAGAPLEYIRILGVTGHVHANTTRYSSDVRHLDGSTELMFEDFDWHEPTEFRFNSITTNAAPDPIARTPGGFSGMFEVASTDQFTWECEVQNESDAVLRFSNQVFTGEMCNVFGFYASTNRYAGNWFCMGF